jgi:hypothetical protein
LIGLGVFLPLDFSVMLSTGSTTSGTPELTSVTSMRRPLCTTPSPHNSASPLASGSSLTTVSKPVMSSGASGSPPDPSG